MPAQFPTPALRCYHPNPPPPPFIPLPPAHSASQGWKHYKKKPAVSETAADVSPLFSLEEKCLRAAGIPMLI